MAPRPSSSGISRSRVTTSGLCWWIFRIASTPSRAVATTRNSPISASPPPSTSTSTRRIRALSSTTRTVGRTRSDDVGIGSDGADFDVAVFDVEAHGAAAVAADRFAHDRDFGGAQGAARRHDVALTHLDRAGTRELAEHTGPARELGDEPARIGTELFEAAGEQRHGPPGEIFRLGCCVGQ